jgi:dihydroorotase
MKILIKQATIIDSSIHTNDVKQDILIEKGVIKKIDNVIDVSVDKVIEHEDLYVSPGWVDVFANFNDPGYEYKEDLSSGAKAAAAGGFTDVLLMPNTKPVIDASTTVAYIKQKSKDYIVSLHPVGAISKKVDGNSLSEMYDMHKSGAVAFSDGLQPVQSAGILLKALQYVKAFDGTIIQIPDDTSIGQNGLINEGIVSTQMGLPGKPIVAEELMIARDLKLARYANANIHFTSVTSAKSLEYIKRSKESGIAVTCSVSPLHLLFIDDDVRTYDTNLKLYPPLRTEKEREALRVAFMEGTIDCIATHHLPHEKDSKLVEFEYAKHGAIGLETCYAVLKKALPSASELALVNVLSFNARKIFGLPDAAVLEGRQACITLFCPTKEVIVNEAYIKSKNNNTPLWNQVMKGAVIGIINNGQIELN